jgi:hypothetical protein
MGMNRFKYIATIVVCLIGIPAAAVAAPTPVNRVVSWEYTDAASAPAEGFYLYYAAETPTRTYDDTRRVTLATPAQRSAVVLDLTPATDRVCFKLTAYRGAIESAYSNEACGFFGIPSPLDVHTGP